MSTVWGSSTSGSRSSILDCSCGASCITTLPNPQRAAPANCPVRSRSSTCAPRVTSHRPLSGTASASAKPCTSASALAIIRFESVAMSAVVASIPCPSCATRCTTPARGTSDGRPSTSACHDSRCSISTGATTIPAARSAIVLIASGSPPARTTRWF